VLAGGSGTRLYPITKSISKQIIPVYDKPMIYYPLSVLMLAGIREILIISTPQDIHLYQNLLGNGDDLGLTLEYAIQPSPDGLAQAFIIGEEFIGNDNVCMILGDNSFLWFRVFRVRCAKLLNLKMVLLCLDIMLTILSVMVWPNLIKTEKCSVSKKNLQNQSTNYAVTGRYFYSNDVVQKAKGLKPSKRGELEITDLNRLYLEEGRLSLKMMGRGMAWLDTGTHDSLLEASNFIATIENRQGLKVACLEEIAYRYGYIDREKLLQLAEPLKKNHYGEYLFKIAKENI